MTEALLTVLVIGIIVTLLLRILFFGMPNQEKVLYLKAYHN